MLKEREKDGGRGEMQAWANNLISKKYSNINWNLIQYKSDGYFINYFFVG